jgi:hypothetical protein
LVVEDEDALSTRSGVELDPVGEPQGDLIGLGEGGHRSPLDELRRLVKAADACGAYNRAVDALIGGCPDESPDLLEPARRALPGEGNFEFVYSGELAAAGRADDATGVLRALTAANPNWAGLARSFAGKG